MREIVSISATTAASTEFSTRLPRTPEMRPHYTFNNTTYADLDTGPSSNRPMRQPNWSSLSVLPIPFLIISIANIFKVWFVFLSTTYQRRRDIKFFSTDYLAGKPSLASTVLMAQECTFITYCKHITTTNGVSRYNGTSDLQLERMNVYFNEVSSISNPVQIIC